MTVTILSAEPAHILALAALMRAADVAELEAAGLTAQRGAWRSYRRSMITRVALVDGEVAAAWGLGGAPLGTVGEPWLLTTPAVERAPVTFVREARCEVAAMLEMFPELRGRVDARYHRAIRLLELLGFAVGQARPFGAKGAMFREYRMARAAEAGAMRWAS